MHKHYLRKYLKTGQQKSGLASEIYIMNVILFTTSVKEEGDATELYT